MDWKKLFLDANGRIGQKDFWIGFLILFVANIVLNFIPVVGQIAQLVLIYAGICLMSKRLHDMGKSGWLAAVPYGLMAIAMVLTILTVFGVMAASGAGQYGAPAAGMGAVAAAGMAGMVMIVAGLVSLAFLLWVGLSKGNPGDNQYGPAPTPLIGGATPA
jgi:uncharacterized membrane protein YhaH (DUF805 family)